MTKNNHSYTVPVNVDSIDASTLGFLTWRTGCSSLPAWLTAESEERGGVSGSRAY